MSGISKIKDVARRMGLVTALPGQVPVVGRVQSRMFPALSVSGSYALATDIPTVTVGAAGATSAIESAVHVYPAVRNGVYADHLNDPFFRFVGVPEGKMLVSSPGTVEGDRFTGASAGGGTAYWQPYVETAWTGTKFEWHLRAKATGTVYYKLWCDGQPVTDVFQTISAVSGGAYKILQTFPGARSHVVGIEYSGAQFGGAWIEPTASLMRPKIERPKLAVLSNSITGGFASVTRHGTWVGNAARLLGMDIYNASIGQTGFLAVTPYASRVTDIAACQPNLVIVGDPYNDIGQGQAETLAAARQTLDAVLSQCPGARVILLGC
ncbi:MAG: hypothetical protein LWW81_11520, partial [Rhodocyclales bacterium]|nr:hypothetical protein [Rhodocyclales bacterium]